jgi:uncharacterized protein YqhQ
MIKTTQECLFCKKPTTFNIEVGSYGEDCISCNTYYITHNDNVTLIRFNLGQYIVTLWPELKACVVGKYHNAEWKMLNSFDFMPELTPDTAPKFLKRIIKLLSIS